MKLVIISGRSGSGKSTALKVLEDTGFYCIDNLPAGLLPSLIEKTRAQPEGNQLLAVCIDARNQTGEIAILTGLVNDLGDDVDTQVIYLDANSPTLIKRFSETRRKHPLSSSNLSLKQAIQHEKTLLDPIATIADLQINTNHLNVHELRELIKQRISSDLDNADMALLFTSFGFKTGIPVDADMVFDVRCLPNPYWEPDLRQYNGTQQPIIDYLSQQDEVTSMYTDIVHYLETWIPRFEANNRSYFTVAIGCTGGKHRSVFLSEKLQEHFAKSRNNVQIYHREISKGLA
ncbi:RNase adapter protein RapZ [BD1-7 clade bacterium]|uniref:RNase adapter protein RapZ n=1 Tax=BD1-7 clade bacterium TaxID=2029982 RepID=A0A5S9MSJ6_9GAMM|nr:RNase adapter protein RapZ [BD1-7 clade bacterium]CAA0081250.1 RNase adapter protein RapZ [BD1-7 clade bacterium]CAA0084816.1 RNase adapter protein RapZ [BD1-7 clade bacterium]